MMRAIHGADSKVVIIYFYSAMGYYLCADEVTANIALYKNNYLHHIWYILLISTHAQYM